MNLMSDAMVSVHKCKKGKLLLREDYKVIVRLLLKLKKVKCMDQTVK